MCARHNSEEWERCTGYGGAQGRQEIDIDFAWKHAEVLLVERKSNWGEKEKRERERMEGGAWRAAAKLMSIKGWGLGWEYGWSY